MESSKPEQIIGTYVALLADAGVKQATIDAVAKHSGLSKAGLLHHFRSRAELDEALIAHLRALVIEDLKLMQESSLGAAHYYLTSSLEASSDLERAVVAVTRLSQAGNLVAGETLRWARDRWFTLLQDQLRDPLLARFAMLAGDGVSYQTDIADPTHEPFITHSDINALTQLIEQFQHRPASGKS